MARYIDLDELGRQIYNYYGSKLQSLSENSYRFTLDRAELDGIREAFNFLNDMPTADVRENVHGNWVKGEETYDGFMVHRCSECEWFGYDVTGVNFCPHCGADMRGEPK